MCSWRSMVRAFIGGDAGGGLVADDAQLERVAGVDLQQRQRSSSPSCGVCGVFGVCVARERRCLYWQPQFIYNLKLVDTNINVHTCIYSM